MYSSDSDEDDKIDNLWAFNPNPAEEEISEEQKKEYLLAVKKSRKILETLKLYRNSDGELTKESAMELFSLDNKIGSTKSEALTDTSEEDLKTTFDERCTTFSDMGAKACKYVELQDIHESYQLLLKIVKARVMAEDKLENIKNEKSPVIQEPKEKLKMKNLNKTALMFKKKKK